MSGENKSKIIFGTIIVTILLSLLAFILITLLAIEDEFCELSDKKPIFDLIKLDNIASDNYLALAKFVGYLELEKQYLIDKKQFDLKRIYSPLNLEEIEYDIESLIDKRERKVLTLTTDCSIIKLAFIKSPNNDSQLIGEIGLLTLPDLKDSSMKELNLLNKTTTTTKDFDEEMNDELTSIKENTCIIENLSNINFSINEHYGCYEVRSYPCIQRDGNLNRNVEKLIATLYINYISFEIDGDTEAHKEGKYSKTMNYCPSVKKL